MKTLPTAPIVPSSSLKVWLTIAPPLEASAPAPDSPFFGAAPGEGLESAGVASGEAAAALPKSKKLVSIPWLSRKDLTLASCDLMVLLSREA